MDKRHSCYVGPVVDDQVGQVSRRSGRRPVRRQSGRGRFTSELLWIMAALALGVVPTDRAWGQQGTPAKAEAPQEPARPEVSSESLSARYRFTEKYGLTDDPLKPELVNQYQVAMRGTYKTVTDKPQGAPDRSETFSRLFYTERPAKVGRHGEATDAVRRYDSFSLKMMVPTQPPKPPWFEGLKIWYHRRPGEEPDIISLTEGRRLRELEFDQINRQLFLPQLTAILPTTPLRVRDTWHIPLDAARNLVGETPDPKGYTLDGTLVEVRKGEKGTALTAKIDIRGEFDAAEKQFAVGARIHFIFEPREAVATPAGAAASPKAADSRATPAEKIVDARGWVSRVLMTLQHSLPIDDRLSATTTLELDLERRRQPASSNVAGDAKNASLSVPVLAPIANEANSWLVYDDFQKRFHFRHPQDLQPDPRLGDPSYVGLVDRHFRGYSLVFHIPPKETNAERDRQSRDPDYHRRTLFTNWEKDHREVYAGPAGWLPEADWLPLKRKVYRIEAATNHPGANANGDRLYCDYYLVLFTTNQTVVVRAMTVSDEDHVKFRNQAEAVIKSFQFGPSEQPESPAATQTPVPKPPL